MPPSTNNISRRELLAGAGAGAAALLLDQSGLQAQTPPSTTVVFTHTTVANADAVQNDVALAVQGDKIAAIGPTDQILKTYPRADVYDGRGKAIFPGLINCHAHMGAVLQRGFNEDFGFPNSARLAVQPGSLLQGEEATLMVTVAALEAIRTGTTTIVENVGGISRSAAALAKTGLRCVFAESIRDSENVAGPMAPEGFAKSEPPRFSAKLRDEGMQRINDLFSAWHGKNQGRISVFPAAALTETSSPRTVAGGPRLRRQARSRLHDPLEPEHARVAVHGEVPRASTGGVSRPARLPRSTAVRGARPLRGRFRDRVAGALAHDHFAPGRHGREPRASSRPSRRCARRAARSRSAPTTTRPTSSR